MAVNGLIHLIKNQFLTTRVHDVEQKGAGCEYSARNICEMARVDLDQRSFVFFSVTKTTNDSIALEPL